MDRNGGKAEIIVNTNDRHIVKMETDSRRKLVIQL